MSLADRVDMNYYADLKNPESASGQAAIAHWQCGGKWLVQTHGDEPGDFLALVRPCRDHEGRVIDFTINVSACAHELAVPRSWTMVSLNRQSHAASPEHGSPWSARGGRRVSE